MIARNIVLCATSVPLFGSCLLGDDIRDNSDGAPQVTAISHEEIRVGQRLEFIGEDLEDGIHLLFEGEFRSDQSSIHPVELFMRTEFVAPDRLVIPYFGPYQVPFGKGDQTGLFTGSVTAMGPGGEGTPLDVELYVAPSIIVKQLSSSDTLCERPSQVLLSGERLHLTGDAIGLDASEFAVRLGDGPEVSSADGTIELDIPTVPDDAFYAVTELVLTARASGEDPIQSEYLIGIHRPVEYIAWKEERVAQIEAPVPVTGCISGGDGDGNALTYTEQDTDVRSRQVAYNWNESWLAQNGEPSDVDVLAELGLRGAIDGPRLGTEAGTWTVGHPMEENMPVALEPGQSDFWQVSSADDLGDQNGFIPAGEFGVWYRQAKRIVVPGSVVERDACGVAEVVAETRAYDYRWDVSLALSEECPPLPQPDLPPAECLIPPCL